MVKRNATQEEKNAYLREWRAKNREKIREYNREYNREWRKKNGFHNEVASDAKYIEKRRARQMLRYAVKVGAVKKFPCEVCGSAASQGHHDDYSKPLEARWLCPAHHRETHRHQGDHEVAA